MGTFLLGLHIFAAFFMILVVLLQSGKGANMGAAFGGSSQTLFGSTGPASFLAKMTSAVAAIFMITSLTLSVIASGTKSSSVVDEISQPAPAEEEGGFDPFKAGTDSLEGGADGKGQEGTP